MLFSENEMHLATIRAYADDYPLRSYVETSEEPFSHRPPVRESAIPAEGEVWLDGRLLPLLGIGVGETIEVGELSLLVTRILVRQPGEGGFNMIDTTVVLTLAYLGATGGGTQSSRLD